MSSIRRYASSKGMSDSQCTSLAPATADRIAESLAGRARILWELATGQNPVQDSGATPTNPQGLLGVDRSGAPWGDALMHPLIVADCKDSTGIYSSEDTYGPYCRLTSAGQSQTIEFRLINRPFAFLDGTPYSRGYLSVGCRRSPSGSALVLFDLYAGTNLVGQQTVDVNAAGINHNVPNEVYFPLNPGAGNHLSISFKCISFSGGCTQVELNYFSVNQIERRGHL